MDRHAHTGFLLAFFVLALMVPPVAAAPVSICNTPMYDGVCCDSTASPTLWPSGNGCCYGGQPYPGPTCPLLQAPACNGNPQLIVTNTCQDILIEAGSTRTCPADHVAVGFGSDQPQQPNGLIITNMMRCCRVTSSTGASVTRDATTCEEKIFFTQTKELCPDGKFVTGASDTIGTLVGGSGPNSGDANLDHIQCCALKTPTAYQSIRDEESVKTYDNPITTCPANQAVYGIEDSAAYAATVDQFYCASACLEPAASPSPSPSTSPSPSPSATPSASPTVAATPTPSASPSASPSATPSTTPSPTASPTPTATPTVPIATPTLPPNIRPDASIKLTCPSNLVIASKITLATTTLTFGNPTCAPQVRLNVTAPKGQDATVVFSNCVNGRSAFNVTTPYDGAYTVVANYSGSIDTCVFAIAGTPPQPTPELGWQLILLAALVAGWVTQRNTPKRKP